MRGPVLEQVLAERGDRRAVVGGESAAAAAIARRERTFYFRECTCSSKSF